MRRREFLRLGGGVALAGMGRSEARGQRGETPPAPGTGFDRPSYELLQRVVEPLIAGSIGRNWVDEDSLLAAAKHRLVDLRYASLYVMDALLEIDELRARRLFMGGSDSPASFVDRFGADTVSRFLTQSSGAVRLQWLKAMPLPAPREPGTTTGVGAGRVGGVPGVVVVNTPAPGIGAPCETYKSNPKVPRLVVVIAGTWAAKELWWRAGSAFTKYIDQINGGGVVYKGPEPFMWSCANDGDERRHAAECFIRWCEANPADDLTVIAHSHGGNVVMWATHLYRRLQIDRLILLGTPMRTDFVPNLRRVTVLFNVYTWSDLIQASGAAPFPRGDGRTLGDSDRVINLPVTSPGSWNGVTPHSNLHTMDVWLANGLEQFTRV